MSDTKEGRSNITGVTRRSVLKTGAVAGLLSGIAGPFIRTASAAEPIKLGVLLPKSGTYAVQGEQGHNGATIAVDDVGGKVLDRPVQLVWLDENGPQTTQQNMHKLIQEAEGRCGSRRRFQRRCAGHHAGGRAREDFADGNRTQRD